MARVFSAPIIGQSAASSAQVIDGSLKFDEDNNNYLKITPGSNGNRRTWTWSGWVKRNTFGSSLMSRFFMGGTTSTSSGNAVIAFYQDRLFWQIHSSSERITTNRVFRDTGWYHIVVALDTTLASDFGTTERVKIYVNGKREYSFSTSGYPSQNMDSGVNSTEGMLLGAGRDSSGNEPDGPFDGQISNVYLIDGVQLGPGYFGFTDPLTGTWKPKKFKAEGTTVNDGTVWSDTCTFLRPTSGFDGNANTSNAAYLSSAGTGTITTAPFTIKDSLRIYNNARSDQGGQYTVTLNGVPVSFDGSGTSSTAYRWTDIDLSGFALPLKVTNFQYTVPGSSGTGFDAVQVDGTLMLDSTTTNLSFGTNGFYLPLDGNSPIGQDQSGQGNNFTPVNFGGSMELDNPNVSGARPILNTTQGGTQAGVGVFGSLENKFYTVSSSSGGGNPYIFDNEGTQPTFNFIRGATYRFDYTSATSHPLRFATAADAAGSSQYTTGTNTSVSNVITITVPHDAPDTLYYYCTNHSGMGNSISVTTDNTKADQYAANCVLALPLVGSNTDVCDQINCTTSAKTLAVNGDAASSRAASNFYSESFKFDGSGDYLGATSNSDFAMGTGDFTLECWVYRTGGSGFTNYIATRGAAGSANGYTFGAQGSGAGYDVEFYTNSLILTGGDQLIYNNKWNHVAVTRTGTTLSTYVNGILNTTTTNSQDFSNTSLAVGVTNDGSQNPMQGHLCDVRIYKGVAKYSGGSVGDQVFVVSSTSPNILPDTPSGVSGGSKLTKITDGAVSFDGTNDYLTIADSDDFNLGSGAFTIEGFCYLRSSSAQQFLVGMWTGNQLSYAVQTSNDANRYLRFLISDDGTGVDFDKVSTGSLRLNGWSHFAVTRSGNTFYLFVDGILVGTQSGSQTLHNSTGTLAIGARNDGTQDLNGIISNVRVIKGTALYTSNFTPPTAPLTNVTNTKLLCCQDLTEFKNGAQPILNTNATGITTTSGTRVDPYASSLVFALPLNGSNGGTVFTDQHAIIKGSGSAKSVEVTGNTQTSTTQSKYYGSSGYFDGTGDYLTLLDSSDFAFGSGDFTIEAWIYITDLSGTRTISGQANSGGGGASYGHFLEVLSDGRVNGGGYNPGDNYINVTTTTSDALVVNRWYHIAMVRNGNDLNLHINGVIKATSSVSGKSFTDSSNSFAIGRPGEYNGSYMYGYIQDYRVYKGTAKYTSNVNVTAPSVEPTAAVSPSSIVAAGNATVTNFNPFNTDINTVRGQETGYPTLNPLIIDASNHLSENNLKIATTSNFWEQATSTIGVKSGKWYWEVLFVGTNTLIGATTLPNIDGGYMGQFTGSYGRDQGGGYYVNGSNGSGFISWSSGSTIGVALDMDNGEISVYPNGIYESPFATNLDTSQVHYAGVSVYGNTSNTINFGQKPFKFPPPEGFQPLNTANIRPETVISRPDQYVGITTWTGDGNDNRNITLMDGFDLLWYKQRSGTQYHYLEDTIRGASKMLYSNATTAEEGPDSTKVKSFTKDGIVVGTDGAINQNTEKYVAWTWKAGGSKNTYNVDDEGFASASDVNMQVGAFNSTHFDQSATWSNSLTASNGFISASYDATKAFNGFTSGNHSGTNSGGTLTFSPNLTIPANSIIEVHGGSAESALMDITVNGVANNSTPGGRFVKVKYDNSTTLTSLTVYRTGGGNSADLRGIRINGKLLVDSGVTVNAPSIAASGCSVGTRQGFSIIKYSGNATQGARVAHGLNSPIDFMIIKRTDSTGGWAVGSNGLENWGKVLYLNETASVYSQPEPFNASAPTDSVFELYDSGSTNASGGSYIAYCWHNVPGLQKFGSFTGNGNANGTFVELGFQASIVWVKRTDSSEQWYITDTERDTINVTGKSLRAQSNEAEASVGGSNSATWDILSNGFKLRDSGGGSNASGGTYIYCAWAEAPSIDLYGGGANAR